MVSTLRGETGSGGRAEGGDEVPSDDSYQRRIVRVYQCNWRKSWRVGRLYICTQAFVKLAMFRDGGSS